MSQYKRLLISNLVKTRCHHIIWHSLHSFSTLYPENPSDNQKKNTKELLLKIKSIMPFCMSCSNNQQDTFLENYNLELATSSSNELIICLIDYHKFINNTFVKNKNCNDSLYTIDFIKNKYADNSYIQHIKQTYNISFLELISNNNVENFIISLRQNMQDFRRIVINEINCLDYELLLNMTIN
jgi:predicted class III extradiol MEMO1 family dioxygenase